MYPQIGCYTRSIFKRSLMDLNSKFSFSFKDAVYPTIFP